MVKNVTNLTRGLPKVCGTGFSALWVTEQPRSLTAELGHHSIRQHNQGGRSERPTLFRFEPSEVDTTARIFLCRKWTFTMLSANACIFAKVGPISATSSRKQPQLFAMCESDCMSIRPLLRPLALNRCKVVCRSFGGA